jgi:hypothetical protein
VIGFWSKTKALRPTTAFILLPQALGHALLMLIPIPNWCRLSCLWKADRHWQELHGIAQASQAAL